MREALAPHHLRRLTFTGTFVRVGTKPGWKGKVVQTLLLRDIKDDAGNVLTDHLWFNLTREFATLDLQEGDEVKFDARVTRYLKGYRGRREDELAFDKPPTWDYRLSHPTHVRKLTEVVDDLPLLAGTQEETA